jgi:hypothetical protein
MGVGFILEGGGSSSLAFFHGGVLLHLGAKKKLEIFTR